MFASPVRASDRVYITGRDGTTLVIKRGPKYEVLASNTPRINDLRTEVGLRDLLALCESGTAPDALLLQKVMAPGESGWVDGVLRASHADLPFVLMIETVRGLASAEEIATSSPRVAFIFFGGVDLSTELGCVNEWNSLVVRPLSGGTRGRPDGRWRDGHTAYGR